jgi:hypothetical protein
VLISLVLRIALTAFCFWKKWGHLIEIFLHVLFSKFRGFSMGDLHRHSQETVQCLRERMMRGVSGE